MAEITMAIGNSHGPLLALPPEQWDRSKTADMLEIPLIDYRGEKYSYEELLAERDAPAFRAAMELDARRQKSERCDKALQVLADRVAAAKPDVMVVVGDDHYELFRDDIQPPLAVFTGDEIVNHGFDRADAPPDLDPAVATIIEGQRPPVDHVYPCVPDLAHTMIGQLMADGFDPASCARQPAGPDGVRSLGHCVGVLYRRILHDDPIPLVPVLVNTYFPPNQPPARRCYEFGRSLGRAIRAWDSEAKVAIAASGGLSHFAVDEEWDHVMLEAMARRDIDTLVEQPEAIFQSGTSEVKNWITVLGALAETDLEMELIDYVPCFRSPAGTGAGMGFAVWE